MSFGVQKPLLVENIVAEYQEPVGCRDVSKREYMGVRVDGTGEGKLNTSLLSYFIFAFVLVLVTCYLEQPKSSGNSVCFSTCCTSRASFLGWLGESYIWIGLMPSTGTDRTLGITEIDSFFQKSRQLMSSSSIQRLPRVLVTVSTGSSQAEAMIHLSDSLPCSWLSPEKSHTGPFPPHLSAKQPPLKNRVPLPSFQELFP
jgi:hypothetical protein